MSLRGVKLSSLLASAGVRPLAAVGCDPEICGAALDSRRVRPGEIFFAIPGFNVDGQTFVPQAIRRGARAIVATLPRPEWVDAGIAWVEVDQPRQVAGLVSREYYERPDTALTLVGITGTNGKTTVAHMVEAVAAGAGRRVGRIGTTGIAVDGEPREAEFTTPEAPDLYRLLADMRDVGVETVAMEVSSHAMALHRVAGARFATAAFLNLSRDHLDFHADVESYFAAKAALFELLDSDQHAVLPADSPEGARLSRRTRGKVTTFGRAKSADVRIRDEHHGADGSSAVLETPSGSFPVRTFLMGSFNIDNVAAAAACALTIGLPAEAIPSGILALEFVPGRVERIDAGQPFGVVVDYAHTDDALARLLDAMRPLTRGNLRVVFGCGGDRDRGKRGDMGRAAAERADTVYATSDNPRHEDPEEILRAVRAGVEAVPGGAERLTSIADRDAAIRRALADAEPGDLVVIAGKGHETTQQIGDVRRPFDDRRIARDALHDLGYTGGPLAHA